jgi:5S rRNA maturation endonuclease (ribonuclease M5)
MANRYYIDNPRGFSNEGTIYVVADDTDEQRLQAAIPTARRITRKAALHLSTDLSNAATEWHVFMIADRDAQGMNADERIAEAVRATRRMLDGYPAPWVS